MQTSAALLLLSILIPTQYANAANNGIVGFGVDLYPDLCCQSCRDSLSTLYLSCTNFPDNSNVSSTYTSGMKKRHDEGGMEEGIPTTSEDCRASNLPWLQTMAYCIKQNCNANGFEHTKQIKCFSNQALAGSAEPTFQESLPVTAPTVELASDAVWLNSTSLVNSELYYETYGTYAEFGRSEYLHTKYS